MNAMGAMHTGWYAVVLHIVEPGTPDTQDVSDASRGGIWLWLCMVGIALAVGMAVSQWQQGDRVNRAEPVAASTSLPMPWVWRFALPVLQRFSWCARPWLGWRAQQRLAELLQEAGLARGLEPLMLRTAQCLLGLMAALMSGLVIWCLSSPGFGNEAGLLSGRFFPTAAGMMLGGGLAGWHAPGVSLRARARERRRQMAAELPLVLEMLALCLAGGQHFNGALQQMARHAPRGALQQEFAQAWAEIMQGRPRVEAIRILARRTGLPAMRRFAAALAQAEGLGMALGPLLRAQARQLQDERIQQAEKQAMEAPVKMLLPLMTCIFPCTFLVLAYPVMHYLQAGLSG